MRNEYYDLIKQNDLADILYEIPIMSYSSKQKLLETLLEDYSPQTINMALNEYKLKYINYNRVNLVKLKNTLIYFCKKFDFSK